MTRAPSFAISVLDESALDKPSVRNIHPAAFARNAPSQSCRPFPVFVAARPQRPQVDRHVLPDKRSQFHPLIRSIEPDESWVWCYVDEIMPGEIRSQGFVASAE